MSKRFKYELVAIGLAIASAVSSVHGAPPPGKDARLPIGKPAAPITIHHVLAATPELGRALEIEIEVVPGVPSEDVQIAWSGGDGLFVGGPGRVTVPRIGPGEAYRLSVDVTPLVLDVLYLTVVVDADLGGMRQARVTLIPVRLAAEKSRRAVVLKADLAGDGAVHSLPAAQSPSDRLR